jgi:hypothetical protein
MAVNKRSAVNGRPPQGIMNRSLAEPMRSMDAGRIQHFSFIKRPDLATSNDTLF